MGICMILYWLLLGYILYVYISHYKEENLKTIPHNSIFYYLELDTIQGMNELSDQSKSTVVAKIIPHLSTLTTLRLLNKYIYK
uniref:Uncharacterized protein n=1 Tax=Melicertus latisulcatus majanivirus TaxID=2984277 RepID=A0A9C7F6S5_9VIRU|nr:MAG: hypothetical protein [Marsupenaeus japonicus endogenous nimavirus]BDT62411.1 MAG: hypothetical protein [Melicertus latisulcatus majanivirus]